MKPTNASTMKDGIAIIEALEADGRKGPEMKLRTRYTCSAPFKFGGRKRSPSNSGGTGRAARRVKRVGK